MSDKERLLEILLKVCKDENINFLAVNDIRLVKDKLYLNELEIDPNAVLYLDYARLFAKINARVSIIQALNIAIKTDCDTYKEQRLLIHEILKIASESKLFSELELMQLSLSAKDKCDELLIKE
ncbi:hypothetical protein [Campylobacter sp. RM12637]|uniref:hypothetical protein n=1 Tax=Campylobacter sp. RM12637 TaxID=2735734 RepID=UPI003014AC2D|nr:hypothetical protein [Campylobacter sp. RM12637]